MKKIIHKGKYLSLIHEGKWEYVRRNNCSGIVIIIPMTRSKKVIFVEQYRTPVHNQVIEFPAGLVNDIDPSVEESFEEAARRELSEETGFEAKRMELILIGPAASGLCSEVVHVFRALDVVKKHAGGGDETEDIIVHEIPLKEAPKWLSKMEKKGKVVDPKIYAGLYFLEKMK